MVEIRGARRPLRAMALGLVICVVGLYAASKIGPEKGTPQKECTPTMCTVNFPAEAAGGNTSGIGSTEIFGRQVALAKLEPERAELLIGVQPIFVPLGKTLHAAGLEVDLKRVAADGAIVTFKRTTQGPGGHD